MTPVENFKNFLMLNNAYDKYCANLTAQHGISFEAAMVGRASLHGVIDRTLSWDSTIEKHTFWYSLNSEWNAAINVGKQFHNRCKSIW